MLVSDCSTASEGCVDSDISLITDPDEMCRCYDSGDCTPEFNDTYTSIVTEVHDCIRLQSVLAH